MKKDRMMRKLTAALESNGYSYVHLKNMHTCVDVLAQKKGRKLMIKVARNIDSVRKGEVDSLRKASSFMGFESIIVGLVSNRSALSENVLYSRFSTRCVSLGSLEGNGFAPAYMASRSIGVKARIDAQRLKKLRKLANMSIGRLASESGVSEASIYDHEKSDSYASLSTVDRLESVLDGSVKSDSSEATASGSVRSRKLANTGMESISLPSSPFDVVAKGRNCYEISYEANFRTIVKRAGMFKLIRDSFDCNYQFFLSRSRDGSVNGVPIVSRRTLNRMTSEDELVNLVY